MARTYAGILGYLGMTVTLLRGVIDGAGLEGTLLRGIAAMAAMALVGAVVGAIAQQTVDESVRTKLEQQLADLETNGDAAS